MPVDRGKTRRFLGVAVAMGAQPREGRERLPGVQLGCYGVGRVGWMPCWAWLSAIWDFRAVRFRVANGLIAENQSTDDCLGWHQLGAVGRGGQSYCLQTKLNIWKLVVIYMK